MEKSNYIILHSPGKDSSHTSCEVWANPYYQEAFKAIMNGRWGPRKLSMLTRNSQLY